MAESPDDHLMQVLQRQVGAVDRRVRNSGMYLHEADEIRRAAEQVPSLRRALGLGYFVRSLTPSTGKQQFLLVFQPQDADLVVLKVYGRKRPGEGAIQRIWRAAGARCAIALDNGDDPTSWLLMRVVAGHNLLDEKLAGPRLQQVTTELGRTLQAAHAVRGVRVAAAKPLVDGVSNHLVNVVAALERHGYRAPSGWLGLARDMYESGRGAILHGVLYPGHVMRDAVDGGLRLLDACAYVGDPSFDAARWAVRTGEPEHLNAAIEAWGRGEPDIDPVVATGMLGVEALMQAGVRELVKEEKALDWAGRDPTTAAFADYSAQVLG